MGTYCNISRPVSEMAVKLAAGRDSPRALLGDAVTYYARLGGSTAYALYSGM